MSKGISRTKNVIFSNCQKIIEGTNQNEVLLIAKNPKKLGFFEKFFHLFSFFRKQLIMLHHLLLVVVTVMQEHH